MAPGKAKHGEMAELKSSFLRQRQRIEKLQRLRIEDVSDDDVDEVLSSVWEVLRELLVGVGRLFLSPTAKHCTTCSRS